MNQEIYTHYCCQCPDCYESRRNVISNCFKKSFMYCRRIIKTIRTTAIGLQNKLKIIKNFSKNIYIKSPFNLYK